jgi:hypothetical protein
VCAENQDAADRNIGQFFDEDRALAAQVVDHELVVHHFVPHVDRRTMQAQCAFHDLDGAIHACAETARVS